MGELNLDAIRARAELVSATRHRWADEVGIRDLDVLDGLRRAKQLAVDDVPALLAEVERLRAELAWLRHAVKAVRRLCDDYKDLPPPIFRGPGLSEHGQGFNRGTKTLAEAVLSTIDDALRGEFGE